MHDMKVCFISHSSSRGGAELSLLELIDALSVRGIECACILPEHGALTELLAQRHVETRVTPFKQWVHTRRSLVGRTRKMVPLRHVSATLRIASAIRRMGCDLVYTNTIAIGVGALAAKIVGRPHIWHLREFGYDDHQLLYDFGSPISRKLIGQLSSACIANSHAVAHEYRPDLANTALTVIYNSVEMPPLGTTQPADAPWRQRGAIRCVLLGKFLRGKGQEDAVQAVASLSRTNLPVELLLLGGSADTQYQQHIERLVAQNQLGNHVHILGHSNDPLPLVNTADIVLMCSRREAFGRVTVEGMKLGKPVIGTRSGGTPEILQEGKTGFLYTPGDAGELAGKIRLLHVNPALRDQIGAAARRIACERFHQQRYGSEVEKVLQQVVLRQHSREADACAV
jgi:glycosyltransferase involved in cell wall biosynthesis